MIDWLDLNITHLSSCYRKNQIHHIECSSRLDRQVLFYIPTWKMRVYVFFFRSIQCQSISKWPLALHAWMGNFLEMQCWANRLVDDCRAWLIPFWEFSWRQSISIEWTTLFMINVLFVSFLLLKYWTHVLGFVGCMEKFQIL